MPISKQILILTCGAAAIIAGSWLYNGTPLAMTSVSASNDAAITGEQSGPPGEIPPGSVSASIQSYLGNLTTGALPESEAAAELAANPLLDAYAIRIFDPIWEPRGARDLQAYLQTMSERGLAVDAFLMERVDLAVDALASRDPAERGRADLLLSQVFLQLADHVRNGPFNDSPGLTERNEQVSPQPLFSHLAYAGAGQFDYDSLDPEHDEYDDLLVARSLYARHAETGGFTPLPDVDEPLERGDTDPVIATLRQRLAEEGFEVDSLDFAEIDAEPGRGDTGLVSIAFSEDFVSASDPAAPRTGSPEPNGSAVTDDDSLTPEYLFDAAVEAALIEFQDHNGLETDGVLGPSTVDALNVTAEQKLARIDANLERWRWAPPEFGETHVRVNIPAFRVEGFENGTETIEMNTIVGMRSRETPVFSDTIEYVVVNPRWYVPESILVRDKLDNIRSDPDFIANGGYFVLDRETGARVEQDRVNWNAEGVADRYRLVQNPGSRNALGPVKIMFPNEFSVYLHGTPSQSLFERAVRAFSSGCVRMERPEEMARWVARTGGVQDSIAEMNAAWDSGSHVRIDLERPIPVHILYYSVEMDDEGDVVFHRDIYDRDDALIEALAQWELTLPDNGEI